MLTTHERAPAGTVPWRQREDLLALTGEVAAVARAERAHVDGRLILAFLAGVPVSMRSSMQRDAEGRRPMDLDAIGGTTIRAAARHGNYAPVAACYVEELRSCYPERAGQMPGGAADVFRGCVA